MILGLDIGGTKTAVLLGTEDGRVFWRRQFATAPSRGFKPVFKEIITVAEEALRAVPGIDLSKADLNGRMPARTDAAEPPAETTSLPPLSASDLGCIGVSIGGPMDSVKGVIKSPPNLPHWDNIPLKQILSEKFSLPVFVEHDGNAGALAEWYFGAGKGYDNLVFITMGTGFGAGLILDGRLYRGTSNTAGEIGHIRIAEDGPACFGKAGSLEGYGSGTGMALLAQRMFPKRYNEYTSVLEIYRDFKNNSPEAAEVFQTAGKYVGRGLALLADMINPECIILGGLGMRIGDAINGPILEAFNAEALKESANVCSIVPAKLGESIGDIATISAAIYQRSV